MSPSKNIYSVHSTQSQKCLDFIEQNSGIANGSDFGLHEESSPASPLLTNKKKRDFKLKANAYSPESSKVRESTKSLRQSMEISNQVYVKKSNYKAVMYVRKPFAKNALCGTDAKGRRESDNTQSIIEEMEHINEVGSDNMAPQDCQLKNHSLFNVNIEPIEKGRRVKIAPQISVFGRKKLSNCDFLCGNMQNCREDSTLQILNDELPQRDPQAEYSYENTVELKPLENYRIDTSLLCQSSAKILDQSTQHPGTKLYEPTRTSSLPSLTLKQTTQPKLKVRLPKAPLSTEDILKLCKKVTQLSRKGNLAQASALMQELQSLVSPTNT